MSAQQTAIPSTQYWQQMDAIRLTFGTYPSYAFDFISVHGAPTIGYSLISPLCLVDPKTGDRPKWEQDTHATPADAINAALLIGAENSLLTVDFTAITTRLTI